MSTKEVDAPARPAPSSEHPGLRRFADRWPFQRKLTLLVGVPLTVILVLLTYLITDLVQESERAENAAELVRNSAEVARLVSLVEAEHQQAILLSVRHQASFDGGTPPSLPYRDAQVTVDSQVRKVRETFGDRLPAGEAQALKEVEGLASLRDTIEQGYLPADNIDPAYAGTARGLIDGLGLDRNSELATTFTGNLLDSLLRADAAHGAYETGVFSALTGDSNALIEFTGAVGAHELYTYQAGRFARFATEAQADELGGIEHNPAQAVIGRHFAELAVEPGTLQAESTDEIRVALRDALAAYGDYQQQAETRLQITDSLIDQIADRAEDAATSAQWRVGLLLNLALLGFALWIGFSFLVRRSVIRPVLALTGAAQEVADVAGRELARVAADDAEESGPPRLRELPVTADDEIGELAEAFNNVQTTAAALLERQVLSRRNVAEMFGNVGRRVSNLTTRQLALIDAVERGETDPALLERLYSIDHIAVRLRRNADSLMLLAGIRETVLDAGPTALTNVVRAALGQIEGYQRVQLHAGTEVMVEPDMIGDLTLMVAELLENAVSFSPAGSPVEVTVSSGAEGASIIIADHGLGMSAERLTEENARLIRRERLDLVPTKVLGLFVVGALARRWDVTVTLSRTPGGGVTAEAAIPASLLLTLSGVGSAATAAGTAARAAAASGSGTAEEAAAADAGGAASSTAASGSGAASKSEAAVGTNAAGAGITAGSGPSSGARPTAAGTGSAAGSGSAASSTAASGSGATSGSGAASSSGAATGSDSRPDSSTSTGPSHEPAHGTGTGTGSTPSASGRPDQPKGAPISAAPVTGPTPSEPAVAGDVDALPRRTPRRQVAGEGTAPLIPRARSEERPAVAEGSGGRPLRRRVRGATLRTTAEAGAHHADRQAVRPADAEAVRHALEEFEAAVERAHRDTAEIPVGRLLDLDTAADTPPDPAGRTQDAPGARDSRSDVERASGAPDSRSLAADTPGARDRRNGPADTPGARDGRSSAEESPGAQNSSSGTQDAPSAQDSRSSAEDTPSAPDTRSGATERRAEPVPSPGAAGSRESYSAQYQNHLPEGAEQ